MSVRIGEHQCGLCGKHKFCPLMVRIGEERVWVCLNCQEQM